MKPGRGKLVLGWVNQHLWVIMGLILGTGLALLSEWVGFLSTGHKINDPIFFMIAPSSLLRGGLLYFPWIGLSVAILFSLSIGLLSALAGGLIAQWTKARYSPQDITLLTQTTYLTAVIPIVAQEFGSLQVLLSYTFAIWIGAMSARFGAKISQVINLNAPAE